jgi:hypothetical protein
MLSQDRRLAGACAFGNLADDPPARPTGDFALNLPNTEVGGRGKCLDRQATEMSWYPAAQEITWICADFVMELRGFEPATSAVQVSARFSASPLLVLQGLRSKARPWIPLARPALLHSPCAAPAARRYRRSRPEPLGCTRLARANRDGRTDGRRRSPPFRSLIIL